MEDSGRSGVVKKKSSSGCLIIKKKVANNNSGGGLGDNNSNKGKKRVRIVESDSSSSDEDESLEFMRRKVMDKRMNNGRKRDNAGIDIGSERKRSKLDLFEFDEYDEFEGRSKYTEDRFETVNRSGVGSSNRNIVVDDEEDMPISMLRLKHQEKDNEAIRLQGKNGVLKVMVNQKKKIGFSSQPKSPDLPFEKVEKETEPDEVKQLVNNSSKSSDKVFKRRIKKEKERSPSPVKEKPKRGGNTEKQMLREKIRGILVDAGWTIEYRRRRNRDYSDAVYIHPGGTSYWSIVKAYDAFKKKLEEEDNGETKENVGSLINKLTRRTKKKMQREEKRKRREAADSSDSSYMKQNGKLKRGKLSEDSDDDSSDDDDDDGDSPKRKPTIQGRILGRCTLLVRGSDKGDNTDNDGYIPYDGKRTVLAWLIDSGTAKLSEKVQYMSRRRSKVMLEGWITKEGIHCGCCSKILTVSKFELHAGSKLRQPFQNIVLESGSSLLECQIDAWNSQDESLQRDLHTVDVHGDDPDDDTCGICGDGGDLICCDSCPSTFHQICLGIKMLPKGDWHCPHCTCKFCGYANENEKADNELDQCSFCEKKYHKSCSERVHSIPKSSDASSFCGSKCQELHNHIQKILGVRHELETGFSWSLIRRTDVSDPSQRGFPQKVECNSKLAVALCVMEECFLPIIDRKSGINIIHNVVYNCRSNFNRLNYRGFCTAILERGDEIICAASIRLHGDRLAEMPFIGTREIYRRQGMCRRLLSAIETELRALNVGQLLIPAIAEHTNTWTAVFGFDSLEDAHKKELKSLNMLVFPGTDMLQKQLLKEEHYDALGMKVSQSPVVVEKSDTDSSMEQSGHSSSDSDGAHESNSQGTADVKPEVESEQKESSRNSSDMEHLQPDPPGNETTNSGDSTAASEDKVDCHSSIEPSEDTIAATEAKVDIHLSAAKDVHSSIEPSEDLAASTEGKIGGRSSVEPSRDSIADTEDSAAATKGKVDDHSSLESSGDSVASTEGKDVHSVEPSQDSAAVTEGKADDHSSLEPSGDSVAAAEGKDVHSSVEPSQNLAAATEGKADDHSPVEPSEYLVPATGAKVDTHSSVEPSQDSAAAIEGKVDDHTSVKPSYDSAAATEGKADDHSPVEPSKDLVPATGAKVDIHSSVEPSQDSAAATEGKSDDHSSLGPSGDLVPATGAKVDIHSSIEPSQDSAAATEGKSDDHSSVEPSGDLVPATGAKVDIHSSVDPSQDSAAATEGKADDHTSVEPSGDSSAATEGKDDQSSVTATEGKADDHTSVEPSGDSSAATEGKDDQSSVTATEGKVDDQTSVEPSNDLVPATGAKVDIHSSVEPSQDPAAATEGKADDHTSEDLVPATGAKVDSHSSVEPS